MLWGLSNLYAISAIIGEDANQTNSSIPISISMPKTVKAKLLFLHHLVQK